MQRPCSRWRTEPRRRAKACNKSSGHVLQLRLFRRCIGDHQRHAMLAQQPDEVWILETVVTNFDGVANAMVVVQRQIADVLYEESFGTPRSCAAVTFS